jgi:hypothetical protein
MDQPPTRVVGGHGDAEGATCIDASGGEHAVPHCPRLPPDVGAGRGHVRIRAMVQCRASCPCAPTNSTDLAFIQTSALIHLHVGGNANCTRGFLFRQIRAWPRLRGKIIDLSAPLSAFGKAISFRTTDAGGPFFSRNNWDRVKFASCCATPRDGAILVFVGRGTMPREVVPILLARARFRQLCRVHDRY